MDNYISHNKLTKHVGYIHNQTKEIWRCLVKKMTLVSSVNFTRPCTCLIFWMNPLLFVSRLVFGIQIEV